MRTEHTEFTVRETFKDSAFGRLVEGNSDDTANMPDVALPDGALCRAIDRVDGWHENGWVSLPGVADAPKLDPAKPVLLDPVSVRHAVSST